MNRTAINNYAVWARREMVSRVSQRAAKYGITEEHIGSTTEDSVNGVLLSRIELRERNALIEEIQKKGYREVMDEVAYTWFNRFTALRFMEVNGYLPTLVRVFTDENNNFRPQILTEAINLEMDGLNLDKVYEYKNRNDNEGLFKYLIITQCNALSTPLPMMFQKISDYTELLFPDNLLREGSVIQKMIEMIPEDDWKEQVQIIGWLYQYYISEKKDEVFKAFKEKNLKATAKEIPAATQLFTPDWIVRYLVDNSLGRLWMLNHPGSTLTEHMSYYIKPCDIEPDFIKLKSPEEIKLCDPCCGSGHMLTYAFDLLFEIYAECGYTIKDAVEHIIKDNLYGIELDNRAGQLAYFALMMKAREKYRRFFSSGVQPNICVLHNVSFTKEEMLEATGLFNRKKDLLITKLLGQYEHADTLGSLITPFLSDIDELKGMLTTETTGDLFAPTDNTIRTRVEDVLKFSEFLSKKYHVTVTNPPYLSPSSSDAILQNFAKEEYPNSKTDMGTIFIERNFGMTLNNGYVAMVTLQSWMFLSSYEKLRESITTKKTILSMAHIGTRGFDAIGGEVVSTTAYILGNNHTEGYRGQYVRLVDGDSEANKMQLLETAISNHDCGYFFEVSSEQFEKIPGSPIAYWASASIFKLFESTTPISSYVEAATGMQTNDNNRFLRFWYEVSINKTCFNASSAECALKSRKKWFPYNKGGAYRKWFGNEDYLINYQDDGKEVKKLAFDLYKSVSRTIKNTSKFFLACDTWSDVTSGAFGMRYKAPGSIFDVVGMSIFSDQNEKLLISMAVLNTKIADSIFKILNPTMHLPAGTLAKFPFMEVTSCYKNEIISIVKKNISLSKSDWDSIENSWNFKRSPLLPPLKEPTYEEQVEKDAVTFRVMMYLGDLADKVFYVNSLKCSPLEGAYRKYKDQANEDFYHLKMNEEELNRIFIDIYGLQDELKPEEDEKMVSIHRIYDSEDEIPEGMKTSQYALTKKDVVKEFISYAVGCMFGRYSLDSEGLAYAGGEWDSSKYVTYPADKDNIIPICDDDYFDDDILTRFVNFVKVTFGAESLEDNLKFIADALGGKGTSREIIRSYFLNSFFADHCKTYQKRPIYWLFDSGKKNGFKALIYMHRYQSDTVARVRTDYVHEIQNRYRAALDEIEKKKANVSSTSEKVKLEKNEAVLKAKAEEVRIYEEKIHHLADQMISIDLDDGVKVNYAKFQDVLATIK